ncbi:hypothetical protein KOW79_001770 [Hemibagrus wyckioides]|uniref:Immunoglobulin V-set domain-containing protein n=2 Tax=Hemibagrus wyckioides TaxID=337641 RepID=A0A9D3P7X7_9TELE|nr:hypothetical protein KOW79_001770 [Hemibagrus wyckioides]
MTTLTITWCLTAVLATYIVLGAASERENGFEQMKRGENFTMECNTKDNKKDTLTIYTRLPSKNVLLIYDMQSNKCNFGSKYTDRVKISGNGHKLIMTLSDMQPKDSGLYIGQYSSYNIYKNVVEEEEGCSRLLFVKDVDKTLSSEKSTGKESSAMTEPLVLVFALIACTMLVVCFLVVWVLVPKVKAHCVNQDAEDSREFSPVYEDMHRVQNK